MAATTSGDSSPSLVWHYTSLSTLASVLASKTLYATEVNFLNDIRETSAADELFEDALRKLVELGGRNAKTLRNGYKDLQEQENIGVDLYGLFKDHQQSRFVLCASKNGDSLYAWRTYASKDDVSCAIGLDASIPLSPLTETPSELPGHWTEVEYEVEKLLQEAIEHLEDLRERLDADLIANDGHSYLQYDSIGLRDRLRTQCKDPGFSQEQELRITHTVPALSDVKFIPHPMGPRPHLPLGVRGDTHPTTAWATLPIREIKLGPAAPSSAKASVRWMLEAHGYSVQPTPIYDEADDGSIHQAGWDQSRVVSITESDLSYREF